MFGLAKLFAGTGKDINQALQVITERPLFNAAAAACAYVGGIDGDWDEEEMEETSSSLRTHQSLQGFKDQVNGIIDEYAPLAVKFGGRKQLLDIVAKVKGHAQAETIAYLAIDVAMATNGLDPKEYKALEKLVEVLGLNKSEFPFDELKDEIEG